MAYNFLIDNIYKSKKYFSANLNFISTKNDEFNWLDFQKLFRRIIIKYANFENIQEMILFT